MASKQSSHRLSAVPGSTAKFVKQFLGRPGWLTPRVPLLESVQRLVVVQRESSNEPAASAERVNVTVLPCDSGRHRSEISLCPIDGGNIDWRSKWLTGLLPGGRFHCRRKIFWSIVNVNVPVFDRYKMRLGTVRGALSGSTLRRQSSPPTGSRPYRAARRSLSSSSSSDQGG